MVTEQYFWNIRCESGFFEIHKNWDSSMGDSGKTVRVIEEMRPKFAQGIIAENSIFAKVISKFSKNSEL